MSNDKTKPNENEVNSTKKKINLKLSRTEGWFDENGDLRNYFQIGKNLIKSREDYYTVMDKFIESGLTTKQFYEKYQLSGIKGRHGFDLAIARRCDNDPEFAKKYQAVLDEYQKESRKKVAVVLNKTKEDLHYIGKAIQSGKLSPVNIDVFLAHCEEIGGKKLSMLFMKMLANEYYTRVQEYKGNSTQEDLQKLLTNDEIEFLLPNGYEKIHHQIEFGAEVSPGGFLIKKVSPLKAVAPEFFTTHVATEGRRNKNSLALGAKPKTLEVGLSKYGEKLDLKRELNTKSSYLINGKMVELTEDHYHTAIAFANVNNLYISVGTIKEIVKGIMMGNVKITEEIRREKERLTSEFSKTAPQYDSIEEYFESVAEQE